MEKECQKKKAQADALDEEYKKKVDDTNNFMEKYFTEKMPKILSVSKIINENKKK